jgi:hypothetical protein
MQFSGDAGSSLGTTSRNAVVALLIVAIVSLTSTRRC